MVSLCERGWLRKRHLSHYTKAWPLRTTPYPAGMSSASDKRGSLKKKKASADKKWTQQKSTEADKMEEALDCGEGGEGKRAWGERMDGFFSR